MKTKNLFFLFACALAFTACGGDDDPVVIKEKIPDIDNGTSANTNKASRKLIGRIRFVFIGFMTRRKRDSGPSVQIYIFFE